MFDFNESQVQLQLTQAPGFKVFYGPARTYIGKVEATVSGFSVEGPEDNFLGVYTAEGEHGRPDHLAVFRAVTHLVKTHKGQETSQTNFLPPTHVKHA